MPIVPTTLEQQFSNLSTEETINTKADEPVAPSAAIVSPTKSTHEGADDSFLSDESSIDGQESSLVLKKTEHKIKEEQGLLDDEPLLKSNPHRFVIFPIQDNEVSFVFI